MAACVFSLPHLRLSRFVVALGSCFVLLSACKGNSSSGAQDEATKASKGGTVQTVALNTKLKLKNEALTLAQSALNLGAESGANAGAIFGQSLADDLVSLKYRLSAMTLCGKQSGNRGDACDERPLTLFVENNPGPDSYNKFVPGAKEVADFTDWVDFLQKGSVASKFLKVEYNEGNLGTYSSVIVNFYRTFKVNSQVKLNNGEILYTKSSSTFLEGKVGSGPLDVTYASSATNLTTGPSQEATFFLPNGGKSFYLQSPFEITKKDLDDKVSFKVALAFDSLNFIKASAFDPAGNPFGGDGWKSGQVDLSLGRKIDANFMEFAPVVARATETILRETYLLSSPGYNMMGGTFSGPIYARLNLYSVKEDTSRSVRAVTGSSFYSEGSTTALNNNVLGGIRTVAAGSVSGSLNLLQGLDGKSLAIVKDFKRLSEVGATGTATGEVCNSGMKPEGGCQVALEQIQWTYVFVGESEAETEITVDAAIPEPSATPSPTVTPAT